MDPTLHLFLLDFTIGPLVAVLCSVALLLGAALNDLD